MKTAIAFLALSTVVFASSGPPTVSLFTIKRTENANELHYEARLNPKGLATKDPIEVYWRMKAEDGHREELNEIEKQMVYGIKVLKATPEGVIFTLRPVKGRPITVRRQGAAGAYGAKAFMTINNKEQELDRLFITTESSGIFPKVLKVEIFARPSVNGIADIETFIPPERARANASSPPKKE